LAEALVDEVFLLWHVHDLGGGDEDAKLMASIGVEEMLRRQFNVLAHSPVSLRRHKDSRFVPIP
jgi:hypothetical protein